MSDANETLLKLLTGVRTEGRPELPALYSKLADLTAKPADLSPLKAVASASREAGQRDFLGGLALSTLGGRRMAPLGKDLGESGIVATKPLRPNAADVGYENVATGEIVANPINQHNQEIKATEAQIKGVEGAQAKELATATNVLRILEQNNRAAEANQLRLLIAQMGSGDRAAGRDLQLYLAQLRADAAGKKGNEPPSAIQKAIVENKANSDFIDAALAEGASRPGSFGFKTFLPDEILGRWDEGGVTARAFAQNIASLKIHDRSGAAVTAAEFPRLKRFVPIAGEKWSVTKKKLEGFKTEYETMRKAVEAGWPNSALVANLDKKPGAKPPALVQPSSPAGKRVEVSPGVFVTEIPNQ